MSVVYSYDDYRAGWRAVGDGPELGMDGRGSPPPITTPQLPSQ